MQFNSIEFLLFYGIFFLVYWALASRLKLQNGVLLAGSYFFYGWWDWRFLGLIMLTTFTTWSTALLSRRGYSLAWTVVNVAINLCILVIFKYFGFFGDGLLRLLSVFGWNIDSFTVEILLPVGISFYTFQAISYSVDVYRGAITPSQSLLDFSTYLSFFPQLLAGPIERGRQLLPQISHRREWNYQLAVDGARETLWGLFKKVAIADMCGVYVDSIYGSSEAGVLKLSIASLLFVLQIYCDFSGYCNMARGLAAMLGIRLIVNFRYPLFSRNPADYWRRWHISLMTWFRDYVYIPLGGSRRGKYRTHLNVMIVFTLSGLWHGAALNFIVWGVLWGVIVVAARCVGLTPYKADSVPDNSPGDIMRMCAMGYVITVTYIFFRLDIDDAMIVLGSTYRLTACFFVAMALLLSLGRTLGKYIFVLLGCLAVLGLMAVWSLWGFGPVVAYAVKGILPLCIVAMFAVEWGGRRYDFAIQNLPAVNRFSRLCVYWALLIAIVIGNTSGEQFIYYQF